MSLQKNVASPKPAHSSLSNVFWRFRAVALTQPPRSVPVWFMMQYEEIGCVIVPLSILLKLAQRHQIGQQKLRLFITCIDRNNPIEKSPKIIIYDGYSMI